MAWFFADEATALTDHVLDALGEHTVWAPTRWVLECTNVLHSAPRRTRIGVRRRSDIIGQLRELPVRLEHEGSELGGLDRRAADHGLIACDASHLGLSLCRSCTGISLNAARGAAAESLGHPGLTHTHECGCRWVDVATLWPCHDSEYAVALASTP